MKPSSCIQISMLESYPRQSRSLSLSSISFVSRQAELREPSGDDSKDILRQIELRLVERNPDKSQMRELRKLGSSLRLIGDQFRARRRLGVTSGEPRAGTQAPEESGEPTKNSLGLFTQILLQLIGLSVLLHLNSVNQLNL